MDGKINRQQIVESFISKGYLVSPDLLLEKEFSVSFLEKIDSRILSKDKPVVIGSDVFKGVNKKGISGVNWIEFEKSRVMYEKGRTNKVYTSFLKLILKEEDVVGEIKKSVEDLQEVTVETVEKTKEETVEESNDEFSLVVTKSFTDEAKPREMKDFVNHYKARHNFLKNILIGRQELQNAISINRVFSKDKNEEVSLIGLVYNKRITKKGNILIELEDPTGIVKVILRPTVDGVDFLCPDEVVGIVGTMHNSFLYATKVIYPGFVEKSEKKNSLQDACGVFIGDVHVGSKLFLEDKFLEFIDWLNGKHQDPKMAIIGKKVKYLFIVGDFVDGIGIYPGQDDELNIKSIRGQYDKCAEYLSKIRKDIKIVICPGNHDVGRIAEPQLPLDKYAESLKKLNNVTLVSNPSYINVLATKEFEGFDVLLYHGYGFDYYAANIGPIVLKGGYDAGDLIMKFVLQKRHFCPVHASNLFVPNGKEDQLVINNVPDIFVAGHLHKSSLTKYKGVTNIVSSCWQYKTDFQERTGHNPEYCKVPVFNFHTGESFILDFAEGLKNPNEVKNEPSK
jgi:DNA polymerase II small subunit